MPGVKVKVAVGSQHIEVPVGSGSQSFQWLGSVVQSRLQAQNVLRKSLTEDSYIVTEIRNAQGELINPKDKIYEHCTTNGQLSVSATVSTAYPVDDWENPHTNDWMQAAHIHSAVGQHWTQEIDAWRSSLEQLRLKSTGRSDRIEDPISASLQVARMLQPPAVQMVKLGFDFSEADVELAFNLDWAIMTWKWLSPLTDSLRSRLGNVLKSQYALLCNIFTHYAGAGKVGQRYGMSIEEFGHFLHFAKLFDWKADEDTIENIVFQTSLNEEFERRKALSASSSAARFAANTQPQSDGPSVRSKGASSNGGPGADRWVLLTRAHFVQALVGIALHYQLDSQPEVALRMLCEGPATAFWTSISSNYLLYTCPEPTLKIAYEEYVMLLRQAFLHNATIDSKFGPRMPATDFLALMKSATLVDVEQENACVACFLVAQLNPPVQLELEFLVFAEFIEALSRLAVKTLDTAALTDAKRVRMGFSMIVEQTVSEGNHK